MPSGISRCQTLLQLYSKWQVAYLNLELAQLSNVSLSNYHRCRKYVLVDIINRRLSRIHRRSLYTSFSTFVREVVLRICIIRSKIFPIPNKIYLQQETPLSIFLLSKLTRALFVYGSINVTLLEFQMNELLGNHVIRETNQRQFLCFVRNNNGF